ncbi:D-alanine--D-alanine ligase [Endozoicomonas sp. OPT23]|uniref:D-alanine--D-alanine ligase n=1 Tax=Endozoicomonas sp. OPT23 TaxID=2072845 RepID=UPI00129BD6D1|nr:D-alanine--D-alanine ligase [Endozoicomonas sp. OPT23]MRI35376.1 D-alanine--D-alanine ligase [Endozoicomonas sp. OPT23]
MIYSCEPNHESFDPRAFGKVAVLLGGTSAEREVSLASGDRVYAALVRTGVDAVMIDPANNLVEQLESHKPDRAFIALHGRGGEDGTVQGLLELMGIPYAGSGVMASALAMDKYRSKLLMQAVGLPTPDFRLIEDPDHLEYCVEILPAFIKPSLEGSSVGVARVDREQDLYPAWEKASQYGSSVLVEQFIDGPEFTVTVLNGQPLPAIKIESQEEFYDYEAKYLSDDTGYRLPCGLSEGEEQEMQALALTAFETLGCSGWGRVDFMQDERGRFWILEVNTVPGMTDHSLVPMAAKAVGLDFDQLVMEILKTSLTGELSGQCILKEYSAITETEEV